MILCHCRVVSDREVRAAIDCGATELCEVARACDAGTRCGGCLPAIRDVLAASGLPADPELTARELRRRLGTAVPAHA